MNAVLALARNRYLLAGVLLAVCFALCLGPAGTAMADNEWKVKPPQSTDDLDTMSQGKGLETVSALFMKVVQWLFGIIGVLMGVAALFVGAQVALGAGGMRREEALQKLWYLILGMVVCFGAWFLVAVLRGLFISS
ncbi:MAG: pilin [Moorellales bacterium]